VLDDDALVVEELAVDALSLDDVEPDDDGVGLELESLLAPPESLEASVPLLLVVSLEDDEPLAEDFEARESVTYQPLPLKTMPTG
jgi:hypothetical protein